MKEYPRLKKLGVVVHVEPVSHVKWDDLQKALGTHYDGFADIFGCQTCLREGPYAWDVEAALERMVSGKSTGTQLFPD